MVIGLPPGCDSRRIDLKADAISAHREEASGPSFANQRTIRCTVGLFGKAISGSRPPSQAKPLRRVAVGSRGPRRALSALGRIRITYIMEPIGAPTKIGG